MTRVIAINLLLIFLPFILYAAYIWLEKKPETSKEFWQYIPLLPLFVTGVILMSTFMISQIAIGPPQKDGVYNPPVIKDGVVIPGHVTPFPENKENNDETPDG